MSILWIKALFHDLVGVKLVTEFVNGFGKTVDSVDGQAHCFADVPDGTFSVNLGNGGDNAGPVTAVFVINILDDLFAAFVFEIDVDVWRFITGGRNKSFEEKIEFRGIDGRDAKDIADSGIGGGSPTLAKNALLSCIADDIINSEKISRIIHLFNKGELM